MKFLIAFMLTVLSIQAFCATELTAVAGSESAYVTAWTAVDAPNGNEVLNAGENIVLLMTNPTAISASAAVVIQNATHVIPGYGSVTKATVQCTMGLDGQCVLGPFPGRFWNDGNSKLQITYGGAGSAGIQILPLKVKAVQ